MTGRARRASTMGLAALVGTQPGQTFVTDWPSPLVLVTGVASAAVLFAVIETPVVSHFFGCTPLALGPMAWTVVGVCSAGATLGAAAAPRLLFSRRVPCAIQRGRQGPHRALVTHSPGLHPACAARFPARVRLRKRKRMPRFRRPPP